MNLPEIFFIGLGTFLVIRNFTSDGTVKYVAALMAWLLFLQLIYKNRILGLVYGAVLAFFSANKLFMSLVTVEEAGETALLTFKSGLFASGLCMALLMLYKFATAETDYNENELTIPLQ